MRFLKWCIYFVFLQHVCSNFITNTFDSNHSLHILQLITTQNPSQKQTQTIEYSILFCPTRANAKNNHTKGVNFDRFTCAKKQFDSCGDLNIATLPIVSWHRSPAYPIVLESVFICCCWSERRRPFGPQSEGQLDSETRLLFALGGARRTPHNCRNWNALPKVNSVATWPTEELSFSVAPLEDIVGSGRKLQELKCRFTPLSSVLLRLNVMGLYGLLRWICVLNCFRRVW